MGECTIVAADCSQMTIYLDYNATTPVDPAVVVRMQRVLADLHGNPSSVHHPGQQANAEVTRSRQEVAALLGARPDEIVFTGGGSEANNLALKGTAFRHGSGRLVTQLTEHPSVLEPLGFLEKLGYDVVRLPVDQTGLVDPDAVRKSINADTILVSIQHANAETGAIQPIEAITAIARQHGVSVHVDAAQSVGKIPVLVEELGVDFLSLAGHKLYGPKGVGVLYVRSGLEPVSLIHGASHEHGRRAGTEAVHQMAGLAEACQLLGDGSTAETCARLRVLRDRLHDSLRAAIPELALHGPQELRLPNTLNVGFPNIAGADLLQAAPEIAASTGSACHEGSLSLSPVLEAMGIGPATGRGALRLSLGKPTTEAEVDRASEILVAAYHRSSGS